MSKRWPLKAALAGIVASLLLIALGACTASNANNITPIPSKTSPATTSLPATSPSASQPPASTSSPGPTEGSVPLIPTGKPSNPVKQVTIDVQVTGDTVAIPLDKVTSNLNTRFRLATDEDEMTFMAYVWDGQLNVRADICPPCRSKSFTLTKGTLVCDSCGTVFNAVNGQGIKGGCVSYPKESAAYQVSGNNILVSKADLVTAYKNTLKAG